MDMQRSTGTRPALASYEPTKSVKKGYQRVQRAGSWLGVDETGENPQLCAFSQEIASVPCGYWRSAGARQGQEARVVRVRVAGPLAGLPGLGTQCRSRSGCVRGTKIETYPIYGSADMCQNGIMLRVSWNDEGRGRPLGLRQTH